MSKPAKPNPVLAVVAALRKLDNNDQRIVGQIANEDGEILRLFGDIKELHQPERAVLLAMIGEAYNKDGSVAKPKGRRPKQAPDGGGEASDG